MYSVHAFVILSVLTAHLASDFNPRISFMIVMTSKPGQK
jgi:hypothetical protein